jgi:hypothetical protein
MVLAFLRPLPATGQTAVLSTGEDRSSEATFYFFAPLPTEETSTIAGQGVDID